MPIVGSLILPAREGDLDVQRPQSLAKSYFCHSAYPMDSAVRVYHLRHLSQPPTAPRPYPPCRNKQDGTTTTSASRGRMFMSMRLGSLTGAIMSYGHKGNSIITTMKS